MKEIKNLRIGNLEFRKASYLLEEPENPAYSIDMWIPNPHYGKELEYIKKGSQYYPKENSHYSIHESCFKYPECCYSLGSFEYDKHERYYEFHVCGDRPIDMPKECRDDFWKLLEYGNKELNKVNYDRDF